MNFSQIVLLILINFCFISCGVKGSPAHPMGTDIAPWVETYIPPLSADESDAEEKKKKSNGV